MFIKQDFVIFIVLNKDLVQRESITIIEISTLNLDFKTIILYTIGSC